MSETVRQTILPAEAWPIIVRVIPANLLHQIVSIKKGELERIIKERAGPRRKGADWMQLLDELKEVGATREEVTERLELKRPFLKQVEYGDGDPAE